MMKAMTVFDLSSITLELETDKALRSLYVGKRGEEEVVAGTTSSSLTRIGTRSSMNERL